MSVPRLSLTALHVGLALALSCGVAACDQPAPRKARIAPIPVPAVPPGTPAEAIVPTNPVRERKGPVSWNEAAGAFELNGKPLRAERLWTFDGSTDGFLTVGANVSPAMGSGLLIQDRTAGVYLRSPRGLRVNGALRPLILVRLKRIRAGGVWGGSVYYSTTGSPTAHGEDEAFHARPVSGGDPGVNETVILVYDMSQLRRGGSDWTSSLVDQIRIDLDNAPGGEFVIRQIAIAGNPDKVVFGPSPAEPEAPPAPLAK